MNLKRKLVLSTLVSLFGLSVTASATDVVDIPADCVRGLKSVISSEIVDARISTNVTASIAGQERKLSESSQPKASQAAADQENIQAQVNQLVKDFLKSNGEEELLSKITAMNIVIYPTYAPLYGGKARLTGATGDVTLAVEDAAGSKEYFGPINLAKPFQGEELRVVELELSTADEELNDVPVLHKLGCASKEAGFF